MSDPQSEQARLDRLRGWRNRKEPDRSLSFLAEQFRRDIEKPFKQLHGLTDLWIQLVPEALVAHTTLQSFSRGVLKVAVDSSARLYELDRALRDGLERRLIVSYKAGSLRKVRLVLVAEDGVEG